MTATARPLLAATATTILACSCAYWPPLVVGDHVVSPLLLFAALAGATLAWLSRARRGTATTVTAILTTLLLGGLGVIFGVSQIGTKHIVLPERGPDDCRVVAVEGAFLQAGRGSMAVISAPVGFARTQGRYDADDGGRPFTRDGYQLRWQEREATVTLSNHGGPVWPALHEIHC